MARKGVFKIINRRTGKVYVGSSNTNLDRLIDSYWNKLYSGTHHNIELQSDFDYYGSSNFEYMIVNANCYSEREVREVREREIYLNRSNTYNEDVPVHYSGGNTNATFGSRPSNANNYIENLLDIVDKSNLKESDKNTLRLEIVNRRINYEYHLKREISFYEQLPELLDIVEKSDLRESDKHDIKLDIKNGKISNKSQLNGALRFHNQIKDLINVVENSDIKHEYKDKLIKYIKTGYIKDKDHLNNEIKAYENLSQYDKRTIKRLADEYCRITDYESWVRQRDEIIFENAETETKTIRIDSLQKEIGSLKREGKSNSRYKGSIIHLGFLNSKKYNPNKSVKEIAEFICDTLGFESYEVTGSNCILFDNKYSLCGVNLGEMYKLFNESINFKSVIDNSDINKKLEKTVKTNNFNKKLKDLIFDYIDKRNIPYWDMLPNGNILLFDEYLRVITEKQIVKYLDPDYAKLNRKFGSSLLSGVLRLFSNKPAEKNPKDELLTILLRSATPIKAKLEIKNQISYGNIKTKEELKSVIKNSRPKEKAKRRWTKHFKICRNCGRLVKKSYTVCKMCNYDFKRRKVISKKNSKSNNNNDSSNVPADKKKCPNCGKEINKRAIRCKHCNYYFKQGKVMSKANITNSNKKNNSEKAANKKQKTETNQRNVVEKDLIKCPNCGELINKDSHFCVNCDYHLKDGKLNTKRNVKFCCECHEEVNIGATVCTNCGSKSFVYNKNVTKLLSFSIKHDRRSIGEKKWRYIQNTDDTEEYIIYAESKIELKRKVLANHLPWEDKKIESKRNNKDNSNSKKSSKGGGSYYSYDYDYDETPSHQYYERDNFTSQEVLGDDYYYINR